MQERNQAVRRSGRARSRLHVFRGDGREACERRRGAEARKRGRGQTIDTDAHQPPLPAAGPKGKSLWTRQRQDSEGPHENRDKVNNMNSQDKKLIRLAIEQARTSVKKGGFPAGAVIVKNGKVISE